MLFARFFSTTAAKVLPLFEAARKNAHRPAIFSDGRVFTYGDLLTHSNTIAKLVSVEPGKSEQRRVGFLVSNSYEYVVSQWAIWRTGSVAVPLCVSHPPKEWDYILKDAGCDAVLVDQNFFARIAPVAEELRTRVMSVRRFEPHPREKYDLRDLPEFEESQDAMIIYTSGTTGRPKGVVSTHRILRAQVESMIGPWGWRETDIILHTLPLHHVHGVVNALLVPLYVGACVVFMPNFSAGDVWRAWENIGLTTIFMGVPTMYAKLLDEFEKADAPTQLRWKRGAESLRLMVSGSSALPVSILRKWKEVSGQTLLERYGMTEIGMGLSQSLDVAARVEGSVGSPLPGVRCKIVREDGTECAEGESGELLVAGDTLFKCYHNKPMETLESFTTDGFFRTGDVAVVDPTKKVYSLLGRKSVDIIKTSGYKVSALDIERELLEHPDIAEIAVVGIPSDLYGQNIAAIVALKPGKNLEIDDLVEWGKQRIAIYKLPRVLKIVDALPRNAMGKTNKKELVKMYFP